MIEMKATDLQRITCQLTLFNRHRYNLHNGTIRRIIHDFSGENSILPPTELKTLQEVERLFRQVKLIYFDGEIVSYRGWSEEPLKIEYKLFKRMINRQKLLNDAMFKYVFFERNEFNDWSKRMRNSR